MQTSSPDVSSDPPLPSLTPSNEWLPIQPTVSSLFSKQKAFTCKSSQSMIISQGIADFIVIDMKPLNVVDGNGFKNLIKLLEPRYQMVSRTHLLEKYIVPMYHNTTDRVACDLEKGLRHAFTTNG